MEEYFKAVLRKIVESLNFCHNFGKSNILKFLLEEKCHILDVRVIQIWDYRHYLKAIVEKNNGK